MNSTGPVRHEAGGWGAWIEGVREVAAALSRPGPVLPDGPPGRDLERCPWEGEGRSVVRWIRTGAGDPETATRTQEVLANAAPALDLLRERSIDCVPLHGAHHLGVIYPGPGARLVESMDLLVSPWDVPRARLVLASRGFRAEERGWKRVALASPEARVVLHWGLVPRGFKEAPLGPFLEDVEPGSGGAGPRRMRRGAAWAAHRLLLARDLWPPGPRTALHLAEVAALGAGVPSDERETWAHRAGLWRLRNLWQRCDRMESWVAGGERPPWIDDVPPRSEWNGIRRVMALQDGVAARAEVPLRWFWEGIRER